MKTVHAANHRFPPRLPDLNRPELLLENLSTEESQTFLTSQEAQRNIVR